MNGMMRICGALLVGFALLASVASAQEKAKGWLGVDITDVTPEEGTALGLETPRGTKVVKAVPGGPADVVLKPEDVILTLDGEAVANTRGFVEAVGGRGEGATILLGIRRGGQGRNVRVTLGARPAPAPQPVAEAPAPETPKTLLMLDTGRHMALLRDIAFTPDGQQLVSASDDKTIRVWDLATGKTVRTIRGESAPSEPGKVFAMALSPDGKWLAAGGWFAPGRSVKDDEVGTIRLYDFTSGRLVALLKGHANVVNGLAFSPDGRHLISGSGDKTAIIWDVERRELNHRLPGHRERISAVDFTLDGQRAVTGSYDHELRLWGVADGKQIGEPMTGHGDKVYALAVAPDGAIVSGDLSGEIWLWEGSTGKVLARQGTVVAAAIELRAAMPGHTWICLRPSQRQGDRHLFRPRQCRHRHRHQPGWTLGGDRRRQWLPDPPLGYANRRAPPRPRWPALDTRRPGKTRLGCRFLGGWTADRLGEFGTAK